MEVGRPIQSHIQDELSGFAYSLNQGVRAEKEKVDS